mmetsp:Transcript_14320/g.29450  ORF Transcript_14320/g.29450 Transcript_14320/m.29450 type:complete len:202 (+) Transcript_14320:1341-1946(+)
MHGSVLAFLGDVEQSVNRIVRRSPNLLNFNRSKTSHMTLFFVHVADADKLEERCRIVTVATDIPGNVVILELLPYGFVSQLRYVVKLPHSRIRSRKIFEKRKHQQHENHGKDDLLRDALRHLPPNVTHLHVDLLRLICVLTMVHDFLSLSLKVTSHPLEELDDPYQPYQTENPCNSTRPSPRLGRPPSPGESAMFLQFVSP